MRRLLLLGAILVVGLPWLVLLLAVVFLLRGYGIEIHPVPPQIQTGQVLSLATATPLPTLSPNPTTASLGHEDVQPTVAALGLEDFGGNSPTPTRTEPVSQTRIAEFVRNYTPGASQTREADSQTRIAEFLRNYSGTPPAGVAIHASLTSEERRMVMDGLQQLRGCAPDLYRYVTLHVTEVRRGLSKSGTMAYMVESEPTIYLPFGSVIGDRAQAKDSIRTFLTAAMLVHEARHVAMGSLTTEPDAYRFELQLYTPACLPNDIAEFEIAGRYAYVRWRASLPYPGEPPDSVVPPEFR